MKIFVIIPGYNEENYLKAVLKDVLKVTNNIIYIDDGSVDKSYKIAKKYIKHYLSHIINLGKGAALKTASIYAFDHLKADAVIFMDSDGQHHYKDLLSFIKKLKKGAKVIFGVRKFEAHANPPFIRIIGNKMASFLLKIFYGQYVPDIPSGFKALHRSVFKKIIWDAQGYEVETEIAARVVKNKLPYEVIEIKTIYHDINKGVNILDAINIMKFLVKLKLKL